MNNRTVVGPTTVATWVVVRQYRGTTTLFVTFVGENEADVQDVSSPVFKNAHEEALRYLQHNWKRYRIEQDGNQTERGVAWGRLERKA